MVFPLTTRGFQCIVISTPRGKNTKFYELATNDGGAYSVHFCDIHKSMAQDGFILRDNKGNPTDVETFKKLYGDASGFEREYECKFSGDAAALIAWAELERAALMGAALGFTCKEITGQLDGPMSLANLIDFDVRQLRELPEFKGSRFAMGFDVARQSDLSSVWINQIRPAGPAALRFLILMRKTNFGIQRAVVQRLMTMPYAVGYGDATGLGMQINEELHEKFGDDWTPFTFTGPGKRSVASALKTAFSDGSQAIPSFSVAKYVATDLYAIQRDDSGSNTTYSESENPLLDESHCDIAYSGGLCRLAHHLQP